MPTFRPAAVSLQNLAFVGAICCSSYNAGAAVDDQAGADAGMLVARAVAFLEASQADDGSWSSEKGPGVTALVAASLLANDRGPHDPVVAKAINYVLTFVQPSGGIHNPATRYRNYETSLAILCLQAANEDGRYDDVVGRARLFVNEIQWDQAEGYDESNPGYGGSGYGKHNRPDLSNTQYMLDALHALDVPGSDPAVQRALAFVSRCQNLETEHNQTKFPTLNPDGGFYYTVAAGGSSQAGQLPNGGLRSYGSMTYAGLKSMIYAGVDQDDPRVKAAYRWAQQHYTLDENPGLGPAGLFYYYHTFAKALAAVGHSTIRDQRGAEHNWREELVRELAQRQAADGSWVNRHDRWYEGDPNLVTGYALLALSHCRAEQP